MSDVVSQWTPEIQKAWDLQAVQTPITDLISLLEKVRASACNYHGLTCDCKFGATGIGEQTGCPELRLVLGYFYSLQRLAIQADHKDTTEPHE